MQFLCVAGSHAQLLQPDLLQATYQCQITGNTSRGHILYVNMADVNQRSVMYVHFNQLWRPTRSSVDPKIGVTDSTNSPLCMPLICPGAS